MLACCRLGGSGLHAVQREIEERFSTTQNREKAATCRVLCAKGSENTNAPSAMLSSEWTVFVNSSGKLCDICKVICHLSGVEQCRSNSSCCGCQRGHKYFTSYLSWILTSFIHHFMQNFKTRNVRFFHRVNTTG